MTETKEVQIQIPAAGDPFTAAPTTEDYAAARRTFRAEMNTGPDPYADPARWLGGTEVDNDERGPE